MTRRFLENNRHDADHEPDKETLSYDDAVAALMSSLHQSVTKEQLQKSAARRVHTVSDMRYYWNKISFSKSSLASTKKMIAPQRMIHITGTKGKGSTGRLCQSILNQHGYSTGLYTSPHLIDIQERIRINGLPVHKAVFAKAYWKIRKDLESHENDSSTEKEHPPALPGYFRMLTLMAYYIFTQLEVDVWIIEVGMGGRYDATNFLDRPTQTTEDSGNIRNICGVTLLDLDHTRVLGNTLEQIAWEKAGIFAVDKETTTGLTKKPFTATNEKLNTSTTDAAGASINHTIDEMSSTVYVLDSNRNSDNEVMEMFQECATNEGCGGSVQAVDATGTVLKEVLGEKLLGLAGDHQYGNAALAIHLCFAVTTPKGSEAPSLDDYMRNSKTIKGLTQVEWPARCQTVHRPGPPLIFRLDGAHTLQSLTSTMKWFKKVSAVTPRRILVFNCSHERDPIELLELLQDAHFTAVYFTKADSSRPSPVDQPKAKDLLEKRGMAVHDNWISDIRQNAGKETWQETLGILWKHLSVGHDRRALSNGRHQTHYAVPLICNMTSAEVLNKMSISLIDSTEVLVTGSLYIVGSFLKALNWSEGCSHDDSSLI